MPFHGVVKKKGRAQKTTSYQNFILKDLAASFQEAAPRTSGRIVDLKFSGISADSRPVRGKADQRLLTEK